MLTHNVTAGLVAVLLGVFTGLPVQDEIRDLQWHLDFLNIEQAHTVSTGAGVLVGVIDSGVDAEHPDLIGSLERGADFSDVGRSDAWEDADGHGTAMAGLIAAHGRALGIAPGATILPVRHHVSGYFAPPPAADAIDWAVANGATVLCLAFGNPLPSPTLQAAVERAIARDVVVVAGVGNSPDDDLVPVVYPAAYPGVIGAAGVDRNGDHAAVSVVSPAAVLAAPAVEIMTPRARNVIPSGYGFGTGTSDATAIIAGVAALVRARFPDLSAPEVIRRLTLTADDRGAAGRDDEYGYGIVNPVAALTADIPPLQPSAHAPATSTRVLAPPNDSDSDSSFLPLMLVAFGIGALALVVGVAAVLTLVLTRR